MRLLKAFGFTTQPERTAEYLRRCDYF